MVGFCREACPDLAFEGRTFSFIYQSWMKLSARGAAIVAQASVLESNSASAPGGFHIFDVCSLIFNLLLYRVYSSLASPV